MILSDKQIEWIKADRERLEEIIQAEPRKGLFNYHAELVALTKIIQVHNAEVRARIIEGRVDANYVPEGFKTNERS